MRLFNIYGTTENSVWATIHEVTKVELMNKKQIPLGVPLKDTRIAVVSDTSFESQHGERTGVLWIGGEHRLTLLSGESQPA